MKKKKITAVIIFMILAMFCFSACAHDAGDQQEETQPQPVLYNLTNDAKDAFDWSYAAGFCGTGSFKHALSESRTGFDLTKIPSKKTFLKRKLDAYGYPYVLKGEKFFIFYYQDHDSRWENIRHGGSTVSKSGCGTVCLSMVLTALTGDIDSYTPAKIARFMRKEHIATPNLSQNSIPVTNRCLNTGCRIKKYVGELDFTLVDETLEKGGYIILDQMAYTGGHGDKIFGGKNHYIVIRGGNQKKGYYIANPLYGYSKENSIARYAPQNSRRIPAKRFSSLYYYTVLPPKS